MRAQLHRRRIGETSVRMHHGESGSAWVDWGISPVKTERSLVKSRKRNLFLSVSPRPEWRGEAGRSRGYPSFCSQTVVGKKRVAYFDQQRSHISNRPPCPLCKVLEAVVRNKMLLLLGARRSRMQYAHRCAGAAEFLFSAVYGFMGRATY